jgi:DTW domain-containing protein YfiP
MSLKQKITQLCPVCSSSPAVCVCDALPRIWVRTRIALIIHHRELSRRSNTGLLAARALRNSEVRIRGEGVEALNLADLITPAYRSFLFFPARDALELNRELLARDSRPVQLVVPDGTWRQARKILSRHPELAALPTVKLRAPEKKVFQLRAQSSPERMATLQAVAQALGIIEGEEVRTQLMALYQTKIERTLAGRGILITRGGLRRAASR